MLWLGFMDGQGSLQINIKHNQYLEYNLIIKLNNINHYCIFLCMIKEIGGVVRIINEKEII
jgi:hypothetical protein